MDQGIKSFTDLEAWQVTHSLTLEIYRVTRDFPREELFGITNQLRRAASSITANIAEGFARYHFNDKIRFYYQARGSAAEVKNFLILSRDLNYLTGDQLDSLIPRADQTLRLINGLVRSIENQK